jgi:E3 ubiquitin ligase SMURF1/2/E3 ubiquitin-protein ligase NEDD4
MVNNSNNITPSLSFLNFNLDSNENNDIKETFEALYNDLESVASLTFKQKQLWFLDRISRLQKSWNDGYVKIEVRRDLILSDTFRAFNLLKPEDLHKWLRIAFHNEAGVDAGGLEREWFSLLTDAIFSTTAGLFTSCGSGDSNLNTYHINPISHATNAQHLSYFKVIGRVFGKAIMEQQALKAALSLPLRKQIISLPITFSDLEFVDAELYKNLLWLKINKDKVGSLMLDFTVSYSYNATTITYDLKENGSNIMVTPENIDEYLQLSLRHRMLDSIKPQLENFLMGLYEVIPPDLLSIFDYQELDLLLCGIPELDVDDWIRHTEYLGEYKKIGEKNQVIQWFWESVRNFSNEERIRLLQFATGFFFIYFFV